MAGLYREYSDHLRISRVHSTLGRRFVKIVRDNTDEIDTALGDIICCRAHQNHAGAPVMGVCPHRPARHDIAQPTQSPFRVTSLNPMARTGASRSILNFSI